MKPGAILFDLDGTIYQGNIPMPVAVETLFLLKDARIPHRFITNNTRMTKKDLVTMLDDMGIFISLDDIFAATHAAAIYCQNKGYKKILLAVQNRKMAEDFSNFELVDHSPEAVVCQGPPYT